MCTRCLLSRVSTVSERLSLIPSIRKIGMEVLLEGRGDITVWLPRVWPGATCPLHQIKSTSILTVYRNRNRNRKLQTSKAPLKSQAQGTSLFTSAASNQRVFPKN